MHHQDESSLNDIPKVGEVWLYKTKDNSSYTCGGVIRSVKVDDDGYVIFRYFGCHTVSARGSYNVYTRRREELTHIESSPGSWQKICAIPG